MRDNWVAAGRDSQSDPKSSIFYPVWDPILVDRVVRGHEKRNNPSHDGHLGQIF